MDVALVLDRARLVEGDAERPAVARGRAVAALPVAAVGATELGRTADGVDVVAHAEVAPDHAVAYLDGQVRGLEEVVAHVDREVGSARRSEVAEKQRGQRQRSRLQERKGVHGRFRHRDASSWLYCLVSGCGSAEGRGFSTTSRPSDVAPPRT